MKHLLIRILLIGLSGTCVSLRAAPAPDSVRPAGPSVADYEQQLEKEGPSVELLYNLGTMHLQAGDPGRAIYRLEQARQRAPRDSRILKNLEQARKKAGTYEEAPASWRALVGRVSMDEWSLLALAGLLLCGFWSVLLLVPKGRLRFLAERRICRLAFTLGIALVGSGIAGTVLRLPETRDAIVLDAQVGMQLSPFEAAETLETLPQGKRLRITDAHPGYLHVRDAAGRKGWVAEEHLGRLWQDAS